MVDRSREDARMEFVLQMLGELADLGHTLSEGLGSVVPDPYLSTNAPVSVMMRLRISGPARPNELAEGIGMTTGGMTKVIDRLQENELVSRAGGLDDGRGVMVSLTDQGCDLVDRMLHTAVDPLEGFVKRLAQIDADSSLKN